MLTPSGWLALIVAAVALVIGQVLVLAEVVILATVGVLLVVTCGLAVWVFSPKTRVHRQHSSSVVSVEEGSEIELEFERRLWPPLKLPIHVQDTLMHYRPGAVASMLEKEIDVPEAAINGAETPEKDGKASRKASNARKPSNSRKHVKQYEKFTVSFNMLGRSRSIVYAFNPTRRGIVRFGPLWVRASDPFGIARRKWKETTITEILALPPIEDVIPPEMSLFSKSQEEEKCSIWQGSTSSDFLTLREYTHGDDLRQVHWKSTARTGNLMVRQNEHRRESGVFLLLDTRSGVASEQDFEKMVGAAASLCVACRKQSFQIATFHSEPLLVKDESSLQVALRMLALVSQEELSKEVLSLENFQQPMVVLTGNSATSTGRGKNPEFTQEQYIQELGGLQVCFGDQPTATSAIWVPPAERFSNVWNSYFWNVRPSLIDVART